MLGDGFAACGEADGGDADVTGWGQHMVGERVGEIPQEQK